MATEISATITPLFQLVAKTGAERAQAYRLRKKAGTKAAPAPVAGNPVTPPPAIIRTPVTPVTLPMTPVTSRTVTPSRVTLASIALTIAAFALAAVGVTMNGYFARSLGSTDMAGWLFLAIGVAADLAALAIPSCAAGLWRTHQRGAAMAGWTIWAVTFVFAVTAGIGFASLNISEVSTARASRVTPAVTMAQVSLSDAMVARDRECRGGIGKFCRERETAVTDRRQAVDVAMRSVESAADPQTEAAIKVVAWLSMGIVKPAADDFAMLRLILLALLPQVGGVLLMVARPVK
jgi:hypothetical protein